MKMILLAMVLTILCATLAEAGPIDRACLSSGSENASPALCGCIQQVADMTLARADQQRAAGFFVDPQKAQDVRASKSQADSAFWQRYVTFGSAAEQYCQG